MATNVIIISDDVDKSEAIGDFVAQAMELGGFKNVECTYPRAMPVFDEPATSQPSLLTAIRGQYADFLDEPVKIRAIKVEGMDVNGYDEDDEEHAFQSRESASRSKFGNEFHTSVSLFEDRPSKKDEKERRAMEAEERRSKLHAINGELKTIFDGEEVIK